MEDALKAGKATAVDTAYGYHVVASNQGAMAVWAAPIVRPVLKLGSE